MKKIAFSLIIILAAFSVEAQGVVDALRFSRMQYQGSARFNSMGGSFGALGGEISSLMINPAGVGVYRNSEFTFSGTLLTSSTEGRFRDGLTDNNSINFNIPNIGFVSSYKGDPNGFKTYAFSISHSRVNTFKSEYLIKGSNRSGSSFLDPYLISLNDANPNPDDLINFNVFPFGPAQAFYTAAIDTFRNNNGALFYDKWVLGEESIDQQKKVESSGRQSETNFSFGGNYLDKLYLGAGIGIQNIRYEEEVTITEEYNYPTPPSQGILDINSYRENRSLLSLGTGINFKFGMIYRLSDAFRLGAAIQSPTYFGFSEEYVVEGRSLFSDGNAYESEILETNYDYQLRTPLRLNASVAYIYGTSGLLNIDYEYVDYSTANFDDNREFDFDFSPTNTRIRQQLGVTHNLRFGTELRFDPFVVRGGFRYEGNPFTNDTFLNPDESRRTYSIGGGFRNKNFNMDLAYSLSQMDFIDPFYETSPEAASISRNDHLVTLSLGWKW